AVDRRALQERAERADGVLRALRDERVPAEPDDRLVGGPVAVVREALTVEVDEGPEVEVGREDVVGEVAVAVERGLLGDLGRADRAVPDERRNIVQRAGDRREALERRTEAAVPGGRGLATAPAQPAGSRA